MDEKQKTSPDEQISYIGVIIRSMEVLKANIKEKIETGNE